MIRGSSWRRQMYRYRYIHRAQVLVVKGSQVDRILQSLTGGWVAGGDGYPAAATG